MLLFILTYVKTQCKRPIETADLLYVALFFSLCLTLPSYWALMYKITYSMGGWRVPLIKFSWFYTFFITSNLLWFGWSALFALIHRHKKDKKCVHLYAFLLSNTLAAIVIGTDFIHYNLFKEHWDYNAITAAFYGVKGGQAPLGIGFLDAILATFLLVSSLVLLVFVAKFLPRPHWLQTLNPTTLAMGVLGLLVSLIAFQRLVPPTWHSLELQQGIPWIAYVKKASPYSVDDEQLSAVSNIELQKDATLRGYNQRIDQITSTISAEKTPNILMVHVEGLRSDMLQEAFMPRVSTFADQHAEILRNHYSSSNNTGQSIFGLLTGLLGTYYHNFRAEPTQIAPLRILSALGYQFTVHNAVTNDYQDIGKLFFSQFVKHDVLKGRLEDREVRLFEETAKQLLSYKTGDQPKFDYLFFNSTHFPFDYPTSYTKFTPVMDNLNYDPAIREDMERNKTYLKNNYLNSVNFADALLAKLLTTIVDTDYWKNTIVIIVGDHGQEFWEHNRFGHVYGLTKEQTQVISVVSFPGGLNTQYRYTSHHDVFPTIFSYMNLSEDMSDLMNGKNLYHFDKEKDYSLIRMSVLSGQKRYEEAVVSNDVKIRYRLKENLVIEAVTDEDDIPVDDFDAVKSKVYSLLKKVHTDKTKLL